MQESFWWWQCSDRYIISLSPHLHTPPPLFSPSLISFMVSVDVKYHVYLLQTFPFQDFTVVPFRSSLSRMLIDALGRSARSDIESWLHILLVIAVATAVTVRKKHCVYCSNYTGTEVNEQTVMLLRVSKDKHLQKACGN